MDVCVCVCIHMCDCAGLCGGGGRWGAFVSLYVYVYQPRRIKAFNILEYISKTKKNNNNDSSNE